MIDCGVVYGLLIPFAGTSLGAAMVFMLRRDMSARLQKLLLGFASGVMVAASVWSLLIPSIDMTVEQGGSQNYVKLKTDNIHLGLNWEAADDWTIRAGCDWVTLNGHWDPSGAFNQFAAASKSIDFKNIDMIQTIPFVGFDWDMSANTLWSLDFRYYDTKDKIDSATYANFCSQGAQSNACATQMGYTIHPFSWYGWQVSTAIKMRF